MHNEIIILEIHIDKKILESYSKKLKIRVLVVFMVNPKNNCTTQPHYNLILGFNSKLCCTHKLVEIG